MKLWENLSEKAVVVLKTATQAEALPEMVGHLGNGGRVKPPEILSRLLEREKLGSTAIGHGIAIPHCKFESIQEPVILLGLSRRGIKRWSSDGKPVQAVFLVVTPPEDPNINLKFLAKIAQLARKSPDLAEKLAGLPDAGGVLDLIKR